MLRLRKEKTQSRLGFGPEQPRYAPVPRADMGTPGADARRGGAVVGLEVVAPSGPVGGLGEGSWRSEEAREGLPWGGDCERILETAGKRTQGTLCSVQGWGQCRQLLCPRGAGGPVRKGTQRPLEDTERPELLTSHPQCW